MSMLGARGLRELLRAPGIIVAPGAYDAVSARLVERAGFPAVYIGSYATAASRLGLPDAGLVSMREMVDHSLLLYAVHRAVSETLAAFRAQGDRGALESRLTAEAEFDEFIGFPRIQDLAARHGLQ